MVRNIIPRPDHALIMKRKGKGNNKSTWMFKDNEANKQLYSGAFYMKSSGSFKGFYIQTYTNKRIIQLLYIYGKKDFKVKLTFV